MKQLLVLLSFLAVIGCKTIPINQKINKNREGLWIEHYSLDSLHYKSVGKYHNGDPIKKWRYYLNGKLIKREKYKSNLCQTTTYHKNGKIQSKGLTKTTTNSLETHWFYDGDWHFFDEKGKHIMVRNYYNGELITEELIP